MANHSPMNGPYTTAPSPPPISSPTPSQPVPMYPQGGQNQHNSEMYQQSYTVVPQPGFQPQPQQQVIYQPAMNEKPVVQATTTQVPVQRLDFKTAVQLPSLNMSPAPVDCPMCHARKMTVITPVAGNTAHAWAGVLFCLTVIFAFVPYVVNSLKDIQHRCGNCGTHLATWHKSGQVEVFAYA